MTNPMRSINTILFDWDGTLVDSAQLGLNAFEQSFATLGVVFDHEIYRTVYSPNWYSVYDALGLPQEKWPLADELWNKYYCAQPALLIDGVKETISRLQDKGYRLGVVSSGNDYRIGREITELGLAGVFEIVVCSEHVENKKPHPEGLHVAMRSLACLPAATCYVGDSPEDIEMGKQAKLFTVGVRSSYPTSWRLERHKPDILIESLGELLNYF
jgi:HAD superfamily hydrolase (TIGR01549 family)